MTNDTTTLNGALLELGELMADNLNTMGVSSADPSDGLTTLASKILLVPQGGGGSCYHIEFQESSYIAVSGSATVSVYLQSNYAPLSGATVSISGSDGSSYTCITNSNGVGTANITCSANITLTASYSNVSDTASVTYNTGPLFYDSGVTGTKNTDFLCTKSQSSYTLTTDSNGTVFLCSGGDGFYIPNIDISNYTNLDVTWTFTYGTRYACHLSLLNSNKTYTNSNRWHNAGTSTPTTSWYTPSGQTTISRTIQSGDSIKLTKRNNTFAFYCNDILISSVTPSYTVCYIGLTSADNNRPFGYKELSITQTS